MSENAKLTPRQWADVAVTKCSHRYLGACVLCVANAIAEAEERGRRAGLEEAASMVDLDVRQEKELGHGESSRVLTVHLSDLAHDLRQRVILRTKASP